MTSGVSVLLPALLIGLAAFLSFFAALRRLNLAERHALSARSPAAAGRRAAIPALRSRTGEIIRGVEGSGRPRQGDDRLPHLQKCRERRSLTILIFIVYWHFFQKHFIPSVDGRQFDWFFKLAFYVVPLMLVWALLRFFWLWAATQAIVAAFVVAPADFAIRRQSIPRRSASRRFRRLI